MKKNSCLCTVQKALASTLVVGALFAWCATANAYQQIYFEGFGGIGDPLSMTMEDSPTNETWLANGFATDNGVLNVVPTNMEGAATLPITLVTNAVYTVEMDVTSNAAEWIGIGFSENSPFVNMMGVVPPNRPADRFAQSSGRAWMLYRPGEVGANALAMQVEIFGGGSGGNGTSNPIPDIDTDFSGPTPVPRTLTVVVNTKPAGFTADFMIDGVSQTMSGGPEPLFEDGTNTMMDGTIPLTDVTLLDNVGFTWEGQSPMNMAGAITVDNFSVSVALLGDVDQDGTISFADLSPFLSLISSGGFQLEADVNCSGTVDFADISPFISLL